MMLVGMSFIYFFSYVKRMITLAFLIIIAPLITVTYSIDKMGDGRSQALNTWMKEFVYNILIQPFQCIIYLSLATSILGMLTSGSTSIINVFIAIYILMFMYQAEEIVKKIFGFQADSLGKTLASAAITTTLISKGTSLFKGKDEKRKVGAPTPYKKRPDLPGRGSNGADNNPEGGITQRGNGGGNTTGSNSSGGDTAGPNNSGGNSSGKGSKRKIAGVAKGVAGTLLRANIKGGLWLAGAALGLSTGDLKGGVAGAGLGSAASGAINKSLNKRKDKKNEELRKSQIARDIDEYKNNHGYNNNQVYQTIQDWLDGVSVPEGEDDSTLQLYQHLMEHREGLEETGLSQDNARERIDRLIQDVFSEKQSKNDPPTASQKARQKIDNVSNIIDKMKNRFTNNG